jgi:hypothetical protein
MQQRSQIPEGDEKTTINALIKGLTSGPTASHLTRKKPKSVEELFRELEEYILSDDDHRKRVAERNEAKTGQQRDDMVSIVPTSAKCQQRRKSAK